MATQVITTSPSFETAVQLTTGASFVLPVDTAVPLFVVGPNGSGKSGLILKLYRSNPLTALRIAAHRQNWMESNSVPFSPKDKVQTEVNVRGQDSLPEARWTEWNASVRSGLIVADLIDADNNLSRRVRAELAGGKQVEATQLAAVPPPLDIVSEILIASGIPIKLSIDNNCIVAIKRDGLPYSIASLSDGERAAFLLAGMVLTAKRGSLILVDEPERHLHASIVTPLLVQLFAKRPDCAFVVSTHELGLPVSYPTANVVLVRDSVTVGAEVAQWDLDMLEPGTDIEDATKEAIIGARRVMLFIEGTSTSLDRLLYELLLPGVSIFPRSTCVDVENAVTSVRESSKLVWVRSYGIVDQDQLSPTKKAQLESKGIFPLSVYSVEALYYHPVVVEAVAKRQCEVTGHDASQMTAKACADLLAAVSSEVDRLAARMTEQAVKDTISLEMPDWKKILAGQNVNIAVDAQRLYEAERVQLLGWLASCEVNKIVARYPIRETEALGAVVNALQFRGRTQYEAAVRKLGTSIYLSI